MISFSVNDMICGHCVGSITQAVHAVDPGARVRIDLPTHRVEIDSTAATAADLRNAITEAGYTPVAIEGRTGPVVVPTPPPASGACAIGSAEPAHCTDKGSSLSPSASVRRAGRRSHAPACPSDTLSEGVAGRGAYRTASAAWCVTTTAASGQAARTR